VRLLLESSGQNALLISIAGSKNLTDMEKSTEGDRATELIGQYLLQGWTMLGEVCELVEVS